MNEIHEKSKTNWTAIFIGRNFTGCCGDWRLYFAGKAFVAIGANDTTVDKHTI